MLPRIAINEKFYRHGLNKCVFWDFPHLPHVLIFGGTGSGKTYALKSLLGSVAMYVPYADIVVCDYKADDFSFLEDKKNYYAFEDCYKGLQAFFEDFRKRQRKEDTSKSFRLLVFDEWAAFVGNLDKKESDNAKKMLSTILMLGRSFNYHIIISQQRADAKYFDTARDNFSIILAMGNISKESVQMFFSDYKEEISHDRKRGMGHIYIDGEGVKKIIIPPVRNEGKLKFFIRKIIR